MSINVYPVPSQIVTTTGTTTTQDLDREGVQENILLELKKMNLQFLLITDTQITNREVEQMPNTIKDGAGAGYVAKVNANNRLYTNAITTNETEQANKVGNAYNINSGFITLTDAVDTPVLYF